MIKIFLFIFFISKLIFFHFCFDMKFLNKISNSTLNYSTIKFRYFDKKCEKLFCFGNIQVKIDNEWFIIKFSSSRNIRFAVQTICEYLEKDNFYSFAFQCISQSTIFFFINLICSFE